MKSTVGKMLLLGIVIALALGAGFLLGTGRHAHQDEVAGSTQEAAKVQYTCSMHPFIIRDAPGACPICGMALTPVKAGQTTGASPTGVTRWRSPMDPTYVRDAPGKDAMGHDLVSFQDGGAGEGGIRIDPVTLQNMGVRTERVVRRKLQRTIRTVGIVTYEEGRQYSINAKVDGWVERLHVNRQWQGVKKGQPLMEIYSPELVAAQQEYLLALENKKRLGESTFPEIAAGADRLLEAARTRLRYWDISPGQIRAMEHSGQVRKNMTLFSEYTGVVTAKKVQEGMRIMAGEELFQLADLSKVWVNAILYEDQLPWVKVGQKARVELPYTAGKVIEGTMSYLYPSMDSETRTARGRIELANPGLEMKPDMYANVAIDVETAELALAIPATAVLYSGQDQTVFVDLGGGRFDPRKVTTGVRDDDGKVEILSGLKEAEAVVVSAQFMLDSESRLREALDKMLTPKKEGRVDHNGHDGGEKATPRGGAADPKALDDLFK